MRSLLFASPVPFVCPCLTLERTGLFSSRLSCGTGIGMFSPRYWTNIYTDGCRMQLIGFMRLFWRWWTKIKKFSLIRPKLCLPALLGKKKSDNIICEMIRWEQDRLCLSGSLFLCSENLQFGLENSKAMFFSAPHSICSSEAEHSLFFPWRQLGIHLWMFTLIFLLGKRFWWSQGCDVSRRVKSGWEAQLAGKSRWLLKVKLRHLPRVSLHELLQFDTGMFS